jgi:hypothetical protein
MRRRFVITTLAAALAVTACGSDGPGDATSTTTVEPTITTVTQPKRCSADGMERPGARPSSEVPAAAVATWEALSTAALDCDYDALDQVAVVGDGVVRYTFGEQSPDETIGAHLRAREADGEPVLRILAQILGLRAVRADGMWAWPAAHGPTPTDDDWRALEAIYPPDQIAAWKQQGSFLGYRVGITDAGDWQYFIAGD